MSKGSTERMSPETFVEELKALISANLAGNVQLMARINELVKAATARQKEPIDASTLFARWMEFNLASYSVISTQGMALLNGIVSAAEQALGTKARPAPEPGPSAEQKVEMRLEGRQGERVTAPFLVENRYDRALDVAFQASDLVPGSGRALPASHISFEPATLMVAPKGQAVVNAAVTLTKDFVVGQTYSTTIRVLGFQAKEVALAITVRPPGKEAKPAGQTVKRAKPAKKRRAS
ncbi:MAG: hypothetical protein HYY65_11885 [Candidatus Tectomicrobia bacterium]|uniref:Uncharacterized protein n=1 Tax=Tectimicrobiota bacterium TaxID=2528274 RepID=A0A932M166_UNCTE|nr:hypothetical protein [Candidatus Tectomicrobia bacterium]